MSAFSTRPSGEFVDRPQDRLGVVLEHRLFVFRKVRQEFFDGRRPPVDTDLEITAAERSRGVHRSICSQADATGRHHRRGPPPATRKNLRRGRDIRTGALPALG
jgi:hypothetical protein